MPQLPTATILGTVKDSTGAIGRRNHGEKSGNRSDSHRRWCGGRLVSFLGAPGGRLRGAGGTTRFPLRSAKRLDLDGVPGGSCEFYAPAWSSRSNGRRDRGGASRQYDIREFLSASIILAWILTIILFMGLAKAAAAQEQEHRSTVWDGVFTAAQADRGREAYALHCSSCHGNELQGGAGPALQGLQFIDNWREDSLKSLFTFIQTRMPLRARGTLGEATYLDILTYILSMNSFPAGSKELTNDALGSTELIGKDGPAPIPKFALISVVGCLTKSGDEWKLEKVSAPLRSRQEKPTPAEMQASAARPLGTGTFRLVYIDSLRPVFVAEQHVGHKLHAHGYLLSNDKGEGLSVTWLEAVASMCSE